MSAGPNNVRNRVGFINHPTFKEFKKKYPDQDVTYQEFTTVLKESTKAIRDHILENPLGFKLPYNFGYIAVDKFKGLERYVAVDWVNSRKLGRRIPFVNLHSFGYYYKVKLYKNPRIKSLMAHKMNAHRILKRMLAQQIFAGKEYLEIDRSYYSNRFRIGQHIKSGY